MKKINAFLRWFVVVPLYICFSGLAQAQWISQTVPLIPGWNAVYLEVQPSPADCDTILGGYPVEGIWMWNKRFTSMEFDLDPNELLTPGPHWLVWLPPDNPEAFLSQVVGLQACHSYLIKVRTNAAAFNLVLKGRPMIPHLEWFPHALNLMGFPVNPAAPPTFSEFFRHTSLVDVSKAYDNDLYTLDAAGRGRVIVQPFRDRIAPGVAYWVKSEGALDYEGPLSVSTETSGGLDFGDTLEEIGMTVANIALAQSFTVKIEPLASEVAPLGYAELAGPVPLAYLVSSAGVSNDLTWVNLPPEGLTRVLAAGETWYLKLGVRRNDMADYTPSGTNGAAYQSILRVTDSEQSLRIHVPVVADKDFVRRKEGEEQYNLNAHHTDEGLWVGEVVVSEVTCPSYSTTNLLPVDSMFKFRLILHVDAFGRTKLLQQVYLAWTGSETNGGFKLYVDEASVPANSPEVNRISSAAFPLMAPEEVVNSGDNPEIGGFTNQLSASVTIRYDDPTNPFRHQYHPLLDNKDWDFEPYSEAVESKTVIRSILLDFSTNISTNGVPDPFYGIQEIGGIYEEMFHGLRAQPIQIRGAFRLKRVSMVNELN